MVFTANATGALKIVGESFPFTEGSTFVYGVDSHNSVTGIREFAMQKGAQVAHIDTTNRGGFDIIVAKVRRRLYLIILLSDMRRVSENSTAQSTSRTRTFHQPLRINRSIERLEQ